MTILLLGFRVGQIVEKGEILKNVENLKNFVKNGVYKKKNMNREP